MTLNGEMALILRDFKEIW